MHFCSVYQHVVCIVHYVHVTLYNSLSLHKTLLGRMRCLGCISNHCNQHCNDSAVHTQCIKHAICIAACVDINQCAWMDLAVGYQRFARVDCVFLCGLSSCAVCCSMSSCVWSSAVLSPWTELMCLDGAAAGASQQQHFLALFPFADGRR